MVDTRPATLNRKLLGEFLKNPETIKAFENLSLNSEDLADVISGIQSAAVLVLSLSDLFENERVISSDGEVQLTDGGPGGNLTFGLSDTGVTADSYGSASQLVQVAINAKGRVTLAQSHALISDNVTEGATNLFFTNPRARAALSGGTGISYNSGTGQIAVATNGVTDALLRQSAAFSVIGRSANTTGNVADISAAADGQVLRRSGSTLDFGALDLSLAGSVTGILPVARGGIGTNTLTSNKLLKGNGTGNVLAGSITDTGSLVSIDSGVGFSIARTAVTSPVANDGNVYSGTYTPTFTTIGGGNVNVATANLCTYSRTGNKVDVFGSINISTTAAGLTQIGISLPVASNLSNTFELEGAANSTNANQTGWITGNGGDFAHLRYSALGTASVEMGFRFSYRVI